MSVLLDLGKKILKRSSFGGGKSVPPTSIKQPKRKLASSAVDDVPLPEKKRARRRLVGAVVMVVGMVIILSMVFDTEPKWINKNIAIHIEDQASVATSSQSAGWSKNHVDESSQSDNINASVSENKATLETSSAEEPIVEPQQNKGSADNKIDKTFDQNTGKILEDKKIEKTASPLSKRPLEGSDTQRALAILNGEEGVKESITPSLSGEKKGPFFLQVGAFSSQSKVSELKAKLARVGIQSFTQKVGVASGEVIRLRIGPFKDEALAYQMQKRVDKIGLHTTLIRAS